MLYVTHKNAFDKDELKLYGGAMKPDNKPIIDRHSKELEFLRSQGFAINPFNAYANNLDKVWQLSCNLEQDRKQLHYGIDGMVVKINALDFFEAAGTVGKTPRAHCAIKFAAEEATTKLNNLVWQVGRTGKITPVVEFDPTLVAGSTVKRATLHNYKEFEESQLHLHDTLVIRKAGDIIPEVVSVLTNLREEDSLCFDAPTKCPECGDALAISSTGVDLICTNISSCPAQILGRLSYYAQRSVANIKGLSQKQIKKFIELYNVKDINDLYDLPFEKIQQLEGYGDKSIENLKQSLLQASCVRDKRFLTGLGIDGVGGEVSDLILTKLHQKMNKKNQQNDREKN